MSLAHLLQPEKEPETGGMVNFRRRLVLLLGVTNFYAAVLVLLWDIVPTERVWVAPGTMAVGVALAVTVVLLRRRRPRLAAWTIVIGLFLYYTWIYALSGELIFLAALLIPVVTSGPLLGVAPAVGAGLVASGVLMGVQRPVPTSVEHLFLLVLTVVLCAIGVVFYQALKMLDHWERELVEQQRSLVGQLRERQGELNRTVKDLDEASDRLGLANEQLYLARRSADEALALKEQFVASVSHELRTPLNLIVGFVEMMYLVPETYPGQQWTTDLVSDLQELYRASRHLQSLVNDVLDLSRIDASRLPMFREMVDIRRVIQATLDTVIPLIHQRNLICETHFPDEVPLLLLDQTRIRQVLINLLNNAVRYTDEGGITIEVEVTESEVITTVKDTGTGMPANQLEKVFEDFTQGEAGLRRGGGAGLGLAISKRFIGLHGGRIWAESQTGEGSAFRFALPIVQHGPQAAPLTRTPQSRSRVNTDAPLILVESDPSMGEMLSRYLGDRRVLQTDSLAEADALIAQEYPVGVIINQRPDEAGAWIGDSGEIGRHNDVPVLRCSLPSPSWLQENADLAECLTKPVTRERLAQTVERWCHAPSTILVVDDDPGFVSLMTRMLTSLGHNHRILAAYGGEQAITVARSEKPDLVLLDLLMPDMDGFEVLDALRREPAPGRRIVAVTATSYAEEALLKRGCYFALTQPQGLPTATVVDLLNGVFQVVRPCYADSMTRVKD